MATVSIHARMAEIRKSRGLCDVTPEEIERRRKQSEAEAEAEAERKRADIESRRASAHIPPRFQAATVSGYEAINPGAASAKRAAEWYCRELVQNVDNARNLVFFGNVGTGKTHLACAIANHAIRSGYRPRYATVASISRAVRKTFDWPDLHEADELAKYQDASLLIIDEIGVQHGSEFEQKLMFDIVDHRYTAMRPTIVAGNVDIDEAAKYIGERVMDRLRDNGLIVPFSWESSRRLASDSSARPGVSHD